MKINFNIIKTKPAGYHWLQVQLLGSGFAAVEMWLNGEEKDLGVFPEPWNTGFGRYATRDEAMDEVRQWADSDGLDYIEDELS